jgi:hypothetical protein
VSEHGKSLLLLLAGVAFVAFVLLKLVLPIADRSPLRRQARARLLAARQRALAPNTKLEERASALRQAATIALEDLGRPGLAASYARRAARLEPQSAEGRGLLASALRRASRFDALERMLWRRLVESAVDDPGHHRALQELVELYRGPLRRPDIAAGLQRLSERGAAADMTQDTRASAETKEAG